MLSVYVKEMNFLLRYILDFVDCILCLKVWYAKDYRAICADAFFFFFFWYATCILSSSHLRGFLILLPWNFSVYEIDGPLMGITGLLTCVNRSEGIHWSSDEKYNRMDRWHGMSGGSKWYTGGVQRREGVSLNSEWVVGGLWPETAHCSSLLFSLFFLYLSFLLLLLVFKRINPLLQGAELVQIYYSVISVPIRNLSIFFSIK